MKKFLTITFAIIILSTVIFSYASLIGEEGDDIFGTSFYVEIVTMFLVPIVYSEIGIYFNCLYFFTEKEKSIIQTFFNTLMLVNSIAVLVSIYTFVFIPYRNNGLMLLILFVISILLSLIKLIKINRI